MNNSCYTGHQERHNYTHLVANRVSWKNEACKRVTILNVSSKIQFQHRCEHSKQIEQHKWKNRNEKA